MPVIEIYSRDLCGPCFLAKRLLEAKGVAFTEHDVGENRALIGEMIGRSGGLMTVPQVFIGGHHVGGYAELAMLDRRGALDQLLSVS
jgi:glutaredoxin 3